MKKITLLLLMTMLGIVNATAQWTANTSVNTLVAGSNSSDSQSIGTSTGKTYVVFWKTVPEPVNYELRVQLLDADGVQQFGPDGILVSSTLPMSSYTVLWNVNIDANDNLYIAVTGTGEGTLGFAYKFNTAGDSLWPNGIQIGMAYVPKVFPLSNGDVIISYFPGTGKGKIQRYNSAGTAVWAAPVDVVPSAAYATRSTIPADVYEHANGDLTTVFHTRAASFGVSSYLFAQRYTASGTALWTAPTQLANQTTVYNSDYSGTHDGDVVYYSYFASHANRFDSYVQRLNPDGTTPWGVNGVDFDTNQTNFEMDTRMSFGGDYLWAICNYTNTSQSQAGEYVQKFDKVSGARQFTDNAKLVFSISDDFNIHASDLYLVNNTPVFIAQDGYDNGATPITLNAVFLDANGNVQPGGIIPVATYSANKSDMFLNTPADGQAVVTFTEEKVSGESKIYAQKFATELVAECVITTAALPDITAQCSVALGDITAPTVTDSCGNTITGTTNGSIFPLTSQGTTTITWTYTGQTGATATVTQNIIINDTESPSLSMIVVTAELVNGTVTITGDLFDFGSTDNCASPETWVWSVTPDTFTCNDLGVHSVMIMLSDPNGNTSGAPATVTITDTTAPNLVVQDITANLIDGEFIVSASLIDNGTTDNCTAADALVWTVSPEIFTCENIGVQTITITAKDASGNVATGTATVTVGDPNGYCEASAPEFGGEQFALYPNPARDVLYIDAANGTNINSVKIYSVLGQELYNSGTAVASGQMSIATGNLTAGTYLVRIETTSGTYTKQLVKAN